MPSSLPLSINADILSSANYGNWQYVSGVGNDPRASRQFNPIKQGKDYDVHGACLLTQLERFFRIR